MSKPGHQRSSARPAEPTRAQTARRSANEGTTAALPSPALPAAEIAALAGQMHTPEGILRLVLRHYPELARPLTRRRRIGG